MPDQPPDRIFLGELQPLGGGDPIPLLKKHLIIGRREPADIVLRFPNVSSRHCELFVDQGTWVVKDLGSSNGTKINGVRITEQAIRPGDTLAIAKHAYEVMFDPVSLGGSSEGDRRFQEPDLFSRSLLQASGLESRHFRGTPRPPAGR
jgi:pSer/pThr/pTyr-binding forkhead associated (FHA) protein